MPKLYGSPQMRTAVMVILALVVVSVFKNLKVGRLFGAFGNGLKDFCQKRNIVIYDKVMYRYR